MTTWVTKNPRPAKRQGRYTHNRNKRDKAFRQRLHGNMKYYIKNCNEMEKEANDRMAQDALSAQEASDEIRANEVLARYDE